MTRTLTLTADDAAAVTKAISITRDEPYLVVINNKSTAEITMTIASGSGDDPLIEIPGTGQISLTPTVVQALVEGRTYQYNIWQESGPMVLFAGALTIGNSIAPTGAEFATTFLNNFGTTSGPSAIVVLTQAEYDAISSPDESTLYLIAEE